MPPSFHRDGKVLGWRFPQWPLHYKDVIMSATTSLITSLTIVYLTVYSRRRSKKRSKLRVTGLCVGTGEFPAQRASNAENISIWWRHHAMSIPITCFKVWYRVSYCDPEPSWLLTGHRCPRGWEHTPIHQLLTHRYLLAHTVYILQRSKSADTLMKCKYLGKYILNFPLDPVNWLLE